MQNITLSREDEFALLIILQDYAATKSEQIKQAIQDEKAGKPVCLFNDYVDFVAALEAWRGNAKKLLKLIQRQTDERILLEEAIDKL